MATTQIQTRGANGVASSTPNETSKGRTKAPPEGDKVVVRRLPPGMSEDDFFGILGDTWKVGGGKVDWTKYYPGKHTTDPSKVSRPSRAYLHVKKRDELMALQQAVELVIAAVRDQPKDTWVAGALVALPAVEISIYKKVPGGKKRSDARQGTIDQDPEFMAFLESLANPDAHKETDAEPTAEDNKGEKVTTTPLVEYLKEKKANKVKEAAAAKSAKHSRQESKGKATASGTSESKKKSKGEKSDKPKETVKILTKKAATDAAAEAAKAVASQIQATQSSSTSGKLPKSRRAGIAAAARILQRDLGLSPGNAHRKARQEVAKAEAEAKATSTKTSSVTSTEASTSVKKEEEAASAEAQATATPTSSSRSRNRKRGIGDEIKGKQDKAAESTAPASAPAKTPIILMKKKSDAPPLTEPAPTTPLKANLPAPITGNATTTPANGPKASSAKAGSTNKKGGSSSTPMTTTNRAFIKHVTASQGVTEATLKEALQAFGAVVSIEVDRRKGFAYAEFYDCEALAKAIAASPVAIGQTTVQVVERKETASKKEKEKEKPAAKPAVAPAASGKGASQGDAVSLASPTTLGGSAAENKASSEKKSARRRGGRNRGGDKDGAGGRHAEGGSSTPVPTPTAATAAG